MITTWSNSMPFTLRKLLANIILGFLLSWRYLLISSVWENVSSSLDKSWRLRLTILGCSSAMWRKVAVFLSPMYPFRTKTRDITAISLVKSMSFENSTRLDFHPSMSTPCLGSQRKLNLLTILLFGEFLFLTGANLWNAWSTITHKIFKTNSCFHVK